MAVYRRGYGRYQGRITGPWTRFMVLPRFSWRRLFHQRLVVLLTVVAMIWPLLCIGFVYLTNHAGLLQGLDKEFQSFIQVNARFFLIFMNVQAVFALFLAALTGPGLIAPDLANNALPLYFSRPLTRPGYALARLIVLFGMLSIVTWIPGLLLFGIQVSMAGGSWFRENWTISSSIVGGFAIWVLLVSMIALAGSAWVRWRIVAGALVLGFFFILAGVSVMINEVFRVTWGHALNPAWAINRVWCAMLGVDPPAGPGVGPCVSVLAAIVLVLALILERKLRPVEVIS
jgi:ABC-2 type transport system permease protein